MWQKLSHYPLPNMALVLRKLRLAKLLMRLDPFLLGVAVSAEIYWHFVDIIGIVLFTLLYILPMF